MTTVENERLAIVENEVRSMKDVLKGLDGKVDGIVIYIAGEQAAKIEREKETTDRRVADKARNERRQWIISGLLAAGISILGLVADKVHF